jgi:hypothetical protein
MTARPEQPHNDRNLDSDRIVRPREIEKLTGASWPTIRRAKPKKVVRLGKRACGMWLSDVLEPTETD